METTRRLRNFLCSSIIFAYSQDKLLLATEGCNCPGVGSAAGGVEYTPWGMRSDQNSWTRGERYGHDILADLNNWAHGWVDWNLLLDREGGPNHLGNKCDAPIVHSG